MQLAQFAATLTTNVVKTRWALSVPVSHSTCCLFGLLLLRETKSQTLTQPNRICCKLNSPSPSLSEQEEKKKSSNLCGKFDVILSPKHRQRINWHEDQPGPWANSGGWLTVYSGLHHLPAFVIVSYYCPYFSSTPLQAVSCSPFFPHQPCSALLCVRPDQSASDWMTDCMSCIKPQTPFPDCVVVTKVHMNQCVVESCM